METWPPSNILPRPEISFSGNLDANTIRLFMESRTTRQRRRFSEPVFVFNVEWNFTQQEFDIFCAFLKFKLTDGCDPFDFSMNFGSGLLPYTVRIIEGKYTQQFTEMNNWSVTAQLETFTPISFCSPILASFITVPMGSVSLADYFGFPIATPGVSLDWRLITDDCGFDILYYQGIVNPDGSLNPGDVNPAIGGSGWDSDTLSFVSNQLYPEAIYLQVRCGGIWGNRPCIIGGSPAP